MRLPAGKRLLGLSVVIFAVLAGAPVFAQTGGITGKATDDKGNILVGNPILIERQDIKGVYKTKTDKHGNYVYVGLPLGNYKVTLQDPNGRPIWFVNKHVSFGDPTEINFDLAKEKAAAAKEQQANPEFQKKLADQAKEEKQTAGLKQVFDQGVDLFSQKKYAEAAAAFEQALPLAKDRNIPIVMSRLADSYTRARQYDKAVEVYQKAVAANPNDANLHNSLGNAYAEMGKIPEAQAEFRKSAELDPANASRAYFNLGVVMYNKGKMDEAANALKKATEIDPGYAEAFFWQGQALFGKATMSADGKVIPAPGTVEAFQAYLKLDPSGKHVTEAQAVLQTIQSTVQTEYKAEKKKKKG